MDFQIAQDILRTLRHREWLMATAESCTGGMIASAITDIAGSSDVFDRGFVTYSNEAKHEMLGVPMGMIVKHGAVSAEVATAMAEGALEHSNAHIAVSVTGIAGPGGGSEDKAVGLVYIGVATKDQSNAFEHHFDGDRASVREQSRDAALKHTSEAIA